MRKRNALVLLGVIAVVVAVGISSIMPDAQAAPTGDKGEVEIDLIVQVGEIQDPRGSGSVEKIVSAIANIGSSGEDGVKGSFQVDSFFDITYASNIGSSGLDGFQVDSFFDIEYRIDNRAPGTIDIEIVAMQLRATLTDPDNPGQALDDIRSAVQTAGGDVYYGHVTVLK